MAKIDLDLQRAAYSIVSGDSSKALRDGLAVLHHNRCFTVAELGIVLEANYSIHMSAAVSMPLRT